MAGGKPGHRPSRAVGKAVRDGGLKGRCEIGCNGIRAGKAGVPRGDRRLQPGKGEMAVVGALQRARQRNAGCVSLRRKPFHRRPPRIAKPHDLGPLVERFAGGIIHCRAVTLVISWAVDGKKLCVSAGDKKKKIGKGHGRDQPRAQRMPLEMIDSVVGDSACRGDGFRGHRADHDAANQAGTAGCRHAVDGVEIDAGRL